MKKKKEHGGARKGSGRKKLEGTCKVVFRVDEKNLKLCLTNMTKKELNEKVNSFLHKTAVYAEIN